MRSPISEQQWRIQTERGTRKPLRIGASGKFGVVVEGDEKGGHLTADGVRVEGFDQSRVRHDSGITALAFPDSVQP